MRQNAYKVIFFMLLLLCVGCDKKSDFSGFLKSLAGGPRAGEPRQSYEDRAHDKIKERVGRENSVQRLKQLAYECFALENEARAKPQHNGVYVFVMARMIIIMRLAELKTEEAAQVLVSLAADESFRWDTEDALTMYEAIQKCGKLCISYLDKAIDDKQRATQWLTGIKNDLK